MYKADASVRTKPEVINTAKSLNSITFKDCTVNNLIHLR